MLVLRGLKYELELVKEDRYHIYHNAEHNVSILAIPYCKDESISDIFNGIANDRYLPLIKFMNENNNLIIKWTKIEGTTSDYTVYCDADYLSYCKDWNIIDLNEYLWMLDLGESTCNKYNIVKDEEVVPFSSTFTVNKDIKYEHPDGGIFIPLEKIYKSIPVYPNWKEEYLNG